jgi:hypothetical protein
MNKSLDSVINDFVTQEPKATAREYLRLALELLELDRDLELNSLIWLEDKTKKQLLKKSDAIL